MTREEEIRARCEEATPGPWYNGDGSVDRFFAGKNTVATPERVIVERATYNDEFDRQTYADIGFIAHAREDIPYLLDRVERLTAELAAMTAKRDDAQLELTRMTDAYDLLNRDYVALRKRAGAAERDMAFACGSQPSASSDCSICDICAHKRDDGSCAKQCFMNAMAAMNRWEWRGPRNGG